MAIGQVRLMVMAVFSHLGVTGHIKTQNSFLCHVVSENSYLWWAAAAPYLSIDFQDVFSIPWPGKCHHCTLCHPSNLNDLVSYEEDYDENENWAVQKETPRMLTVKYFHCKFSLLDVVTGLNMKEHFTSFTSPEDLSFRVWWRIGCLLLRSWILIVDRIILDEAKWNKSRVRGDKTGNQR